MTATADRPLDHLGQRRLRTSVTAAWYAGAFASYATLSTWQKWLLNWIVAPLWLVGVLVRTVVDRGPVATASRSLDRAACSVGRLGLVYVVTTRLWAPMGRAESAFRSGKRADGLAS